MIKKILSSGRAGAEKAALDIGEKLNIPVDGLGKNYHQNVIDSDGTLILAADEILGEVAQIIKYAEEIKKPCLILDLNQYPSPQLVISWVIENKISTLNITGQREGVQPGIYSAAYEFLIAMYYSFSNRF